MNEMKSNSVAIRLCPISFKHQMVHLFHESWPKYSTCRSVFLTAFHFGFKSHHNARWIDVGDCFSLNGWTTERWFNDQLEFCTKSQCRKKTKSFVTEVSKRLTHTKKQYIKCYVLYQNALFSIQVFSFLLMVPWIRATHMNLLPELE